MKHHHPRIRMAKVSTEDKDRLQALLELRDKVLEHRKLGAKLELHPDVTLEQFREATERRIATYAAAREVWGLAKAKLITRGIDLADFTSAITQPEGKLFTIRPVPPTTP